MTNTTKPARYHGITDRGREAIQPSLTEVVSALGAYASPEDLLVTATSDEQPDVWYVYKSQARLDVDLQRGPITARSPGWWAIVRVVD